MSRLLCLTAASVLGACPVLCRAAIDFTPRYCDILADGVALHSLYLQDGPQRVFLRVPLRWEVKGEGGALVLTSADHPAARVDIRASAVKLPSTPDEKWVKMITPQLLKSLPGNAEKGAVVETKANPLPINSWSSFEFRLAYEVAGVKYLRSVCFISLVNNQSMEVLTGATEGELGPARAAAFTLLGSWQEPPVKVMQRMLQ